MNTDLFAKICGIRVIGGYVYDQGANECEGTQIFLKWG